jgi:glycosyltransferase involved in cell wall biosynthesis
MRVLALCSFPEVAAATRFRLLQLRPELARGGIDLEVRPFLDEQAFAELYDRAAWRSTARRLAAAAARRAADVVRGGAADVVLVQREAMLFGPPVVEWVLSAARRLPLVLDLDDSTWVSYRSPTYGRLAQILKWPGKTDWLIRRAQVVTCGNREIAGHAAALGATTRIVPTVVDTDRYAPVAARQAGVPTVGWIGSHSTYPYLAGLFPALASAAERIPFRLLVVGAGQAVPPIAGVEVEAREWRLAREVADFRSLDVGLYPIGGDEWSAGKSGLKAIEYMAVGIPYVASPVGAAGELGEPGATHLLASSPQEWCDALVRLLGDAALRQEMGGAGRRHVLARYTLGHAAGELAAALREAAAGSGRGGIGRSGARGGGAAPAAGANTSG